MIKRIAIVGPEASGKTVLAKQLAQHFKDPWVPEFARAYLEGKNGIYKQSHLDFIAEQQIASEISLAKEATRFIFCDTNPLVVKIWSNYKFGNCSQQILKIVDESNYQLHLLLKPDLNYEDDLLRENPDINDRNELFQIYLQELIDSQANYFIIEGEGKIRLKNALRILQKNFY